MSCGGWVWFVYCWMFIVFMLVVVVNFVVCGLGQGEFLVWIIYLLLLLLFLQFFIGLYLFVLYYVGKCVSVMVGVVC